MLKQNNLETITTERNALKLQLEKLEVTINTVCLYHVISIYQNARFFQNKY